MMIGHLREGAINTLMGGFAFFRVGYASISGILGWVLININNFRGGYCQMKKC